MRRLVFAAAAIAALQANAQADTLIVGNKNENTVSFIDLALGRELVRRETGKAPHEIAVSPDGKRAVIVSYRTQGYDGNTLHVFDVESATRFATIDLGQHKGPHGLKWIPGSDRVIVTTEVSQSVVVADIAKGEVIGSVATGQEGSHMVALSPDATRAYVANIGDGSFTVIDLAKMEKLRDVKAGEGTEAISVSRDGKEIWVGNNNSRSIMVFDAASFEKKAEIKTGGIPIRVEISPDGAVAAVSEVDLGRVSIYDAASREKIAAVKLGDADAGGPVTLLFSPSGDRLWAAATSSAKVVEIETKDWTITRTLAAGEGSDGLGYSLLDAHALD